jgi:hypothetical protein
MAGMAKTGHNGSCFIRLSMLKYVFRKINYSPWFHTFAANGRLRQFTPAEREKCQEGRPSGQRFGDRLNHLEGLQPGQDVLAVRAAVFVEPAL